MAESTASHAAHILNLPEELLLEIFGYYTCESKAPFDWHTFQKVTTSLIDRDIANIRLTCKPFANIVTPILFRTRQFKWKGTEVKRVDRMARITKLRDSAFAIPRGTLRCIRLVMADNLLSLDFRLVLSHFETLTIRGTFPNLRSIAVRYFGLARNRKSDPNITRVLKATSRLFIRLMNILGEQCGDGMDVAIQLGMSRAGITKDRYTLALKNMIQALPACATSLLILWTIGLDQNSRFVSGEEVARDLGAVLNRLPKLKELILYVSGDFDVNLVMAERSNPWASLERLQLLRWPLTQATLEKIGLANLKSIDLRKSITVRNWSYESMTPQEVQPYLWSALKTSGTRLRHISALACNGIPLFDYVSFSGHNLRSLVLRLNIADRYRRRDTIEAEAYHFWVRILPTFYASLEELVVDVHDNWNAAAHCTMPNYLTHIYANMHATTMPPAEIIVPRGQAENKFHATRNATEPWQIPEGFDFTSSKLQRLRLISHHEDRTLSCLNTLVASCPNVQDVKLSYIRFKDNKTPEEVQSFLQQVPAWQLGVRPSYSKEMLIHLCYAIVGPDSDEERWLEVRESESFFVVTPEKDVHQVYDRSSELIST